MTTTVHNTVTDAAVTTPVFDNLAEWGVNTDYADIPAFALHSAKHAILDFLGVALVGSEHQLAPALRNYVERANSDRACGLIGPHGRAGPEAAALFNSAVGHVLDFDDCSDTLGGHPTVPLLPSLLAVAEQRRSSGPELLNAYCVGYEVLAHLAELVNFEHYDKGWHPTATLGVLGSAAGCARLLGLDAAGMSAALSIGASFASGLKVNFGTDMKPIQVGHAARNGLAAAQMAEAGIVGSSDAFEGHRGFGDLYNGPGLFRVEPIRRDGPADWGLVDPGLVIKQYPCCGSTHPVVDAALTLQKEIADPLDVETAVVRLHPRRLAHTDRPAPTAPLEAKFSVQYAAATALVRGNVTLRHFKPAHLKDPVVKAVLTRVVAEPLPEERYGPEHFAGEVEVVLRSGARHTQRVEKAKGRGAKLALSDEEVVTKFRGCAEGLLVDDDIADVVRSVFDLDCVGDARPLLEMVTDR